MNAPYPDADRADARRSCERVPLRPGIRRSRARAEPRLGAGRLEQLDRVARRILDEDLLAAGHDVVAFPFVLRTTDVDAARAFYVAVLGTGVLDIVRLHEQAIVRGARPIGSASST